jgi:glycosyltransferase involved in cell wall biosynthesis
MVSKNSSKKILVMTDWYEPGFKAGGPIRSCVNFAAHMKSRYEIFILTGDRDLGDSTPYKEIKVGSWLQADGVNIFYASPAEQSYASLKKIIADVNPDYIYLNSLFSRRFTIFPILMQWLGSLKGRLVLAPRGMLKASALNFKKAKKTIYLLLFRLVGIQKKILWQATDSQERQDILQKFPNAQIIEAANFSAPVLLQAKPIVKTSGTLRMIFVGRIHPIKNLDYLLCRINETKADIQLDIVGSLEDAAYWKRCQEQISRFGLKVNFMGELNHDRLLSVLERSHIFALPTTGENFGHAIFEAFAAGRPALISDQTPWRNLSEAMAGWDIPLDNTAEFRAAIESALNWDQINYDQWSRSAWNFAVKNVDSDGLMNTYKKLFS